MALEEYMLQCSTKGLLGIDCFGCGLQRSVVYVFTGEFEKAFDLFPAVYPLLILVCFVLFQLLYSKKNFSRFIIIFALITVLVMVISYFYRNQEFIHLILQNHESN